MVEEQILLYEGQEEELRLVGYLRNVLPETTNLKQLLFFMILKSSDIEDLCDLADSLIFLKDDLLDELDLLEFMELLQRKLQQIVKEKIFPFLYRKFFQRVYCFLKISLEELNEFENSEGFITINSRKLRKQILRFNLFCYLTHLISGKKFKKLIDLLFEILKSRCPEPGRGFYLPLLGQVLFRCGGSLLRKLHLLTKKMPEKVKIF